MKRCVRSSVGSLLLSLALLGCNEAPPPQTTTPTPTEETVAPSTEEVVRIGVLVIDSAVSVNRRYGPLLDYLSEVTGRPFELVPVTQDSQFTEVAQDNLDFTTNNPLAAVQIQRLHNTQFLVTHSRPQTGSQFSALIVVRADSDIQTIADLQGKDGACVDFETAAAGCVFQIYHLQQQGIDPFVDFNSFVENKSQDSIVLAVLNGTIDVGFIRTGQLEKMVAEGLLDDREAVRILDAKEGDFFYTHTTALYPEWPIAALENTDPALTAQVTEALLSIPPEHPVLAAAKIDGFLPPEDYTALSDLIKTLELRSWDAE